MACGHSMSSLSTFRMHSASRVSVASLPVDVCRICHCESEPGSAPLISPCACAGTLRYVHQSCLQQWIKSANTKSCELCKLNFQMTTTVKPFRKVGHHCTDAHFFCLWTAVTDFCQTRHVTYSVCLITWCQNTTLYSMCPLLLSDVRRQNLLIQ